MENSMQQNTTTAKTTTVAERERSDQRTIVLTSTLGTYDEPARDFDVQPWEHFYFDRDEPREFEPRVQIRIAHDASAADVYRAFWDAIRIFRNVANHSGDLQALEEERFLNVLSDEVALHRMLTVEMSEDEEIRYRHNVQKLLGPA